MKYTALIIALFFAPLATRAQLDIYGGYTAVPCSGSSGTWSVVKQYSRMIQCDPLQHAWFGKMVDSINPNNDNDQFGRNSASYAYSGSSPKFASEAIWGNETNLQLLSWGMNSVGPYGISAVWPIESSTHLPFVTTGRSCIYDLVLGAWPSGITAAVKNVFYGASPIYASAGGYQPGVGVCDYDDPNYYTAFAWQFTVDTEQPFQTIAGSTYKLFLQAIIGEESDETYGYNAGYDFATTPSGKNQPHVSMIVATGSPVQTGNSVVSYVTAGAIYPNYQVYQKVTWMNQLISEYTTIGALNTAWSTSGYYTTFGTSGKCWGASGNFSFMTCAGGNGSAASTTGSGSGPYTATLNGTVSKHSVAVWVGSTMACGDNGSGAWASASNQAVGCTSGSINYSSGAISITFNTTPSQTPTVEYIQNGWGIGTGIMDEDANNATSQGWWGTCGSLNYPATSCNLATYGSMNATLEADLKVFEYTITKNWLSQQRTIVKAAFPWAEFWSGPSGTWGAPQSCAVSQAVGQYSDVFSMENPGVTQSMLDFIHTCAGDVGIDMLQFATAQPDSIFGFSAVSATHSGTTVSVTSPVFTSWYYYSSRGNPTVDVSNCSDPTYDATGMTLGSIASGSETATYTLGMAPSTSSATGCIVAFEPTLPAASFSTQAANGANFVSVSNGFISAAFTADGVHPYVDYEWWEFYDDFSFFNNYGLETVKGNAYDGTEDVSASVSCVAPLASYSCGGELQNYGNVISSVLTVNNSIDSSMESLSSTTVINNATLRNAVIP